jgi:hypothetical protein
MKQENVINLYNALSAKVASAPTLDNAAYVRTYAILNTAKYASKEASVFGGIAKGLRAGGQGARRIFNSAKRFNKDVFNAGKESAKYGKRVYDAVNPSLSGTKRLGLGIGYGASNFGKGLKEAIKKNPKGAIATGAGLGGVGIGAGSLAFGGDDDNVTPVKPTYDWQNDFMGSLRRWIKENPELAALAFGGLGLGIGAMAY